MLLKKNKMKSILYKNIKKIRELKDLTRDYVASQLNMSTSGYGKIERGEVDLTISKLTKIAVVLNVSVDFILRFNIATFFEE
jgi:transcriptional regulator with XRE-family HTH domain